MAGPIEPTRPPDPPELRRGLQAADADEQALARGVRRHIVRSVLWTVPALGLIGLLGGSRIMQDPMMLGGTVLFAGFSLHAWFRPLRHTYLLKRDPTPEILAAGGIPESLAAGGIPEMPQGESPTPERRLAILELIDELEIAGGGTRRSTTFGRWITHWALRLASASMLASGVVGLMVGAWGLAAVGGVAGLGGALLSRRFDAGERRREEALAILRAELDKLERQVSPPNSPPAS